MSRLKLPGNDIVRSDGKVILVNGRLDSIGNLYRAQPSTIYTSYTYIYVYTLSLYIACCRIETVEDANPSYFRINFDSIERLLPLLQVKSPPEIDAKQSCRTKLCNDRLRGKNVSEGLDKARTSPTEQKSRG
ncbi:hypothetical protein PUN28_003088 [Cardiocondyla obscurior]|uniref:Uncharacterized protein n=1 Tax=Cardiocondyla obscurior TaxID=286306 RepID=A0AAW2GMA0_9HYME